MTVLPPWLGEPENFSPDKLRRMADTGAITSVANLEKAVSALEYVAQLQNEGLDFVFKGGSAVQLLLGETLRLSTDVDICTSVSESEIVAAMRRVESRFSGAAFKVFEPRERTLGEVPFFSYRVGTPGVIGKPLPFLLDVMGLKPGYALQLTPLKSFFYDSNLSITTPTVGAILGDKLSCIGPNTVGRVMNDSRNGLEYVKHFNDINSLSSTLPNFKQCREAYEERLTLMKKVS